jgi:hypothetical protein
MKNNVKIRKIERLFEGGPIDLFELFHFLVDEIENYKVLEFKSNKEYLIKFYRKGDDLNFMDLIDSEGVKLIQKYKIKYFFEIISLREVEESELINQIWSVKHIIE